MNGELIVCFSILGGIAYLIYRIIKQAQIYSKILQESQKEKDPHQANVENLLGLIVILLLASFFSKIKLIL